MSNISEIDVAKIWHPYTPHGDAPPIPVKSAREAILYTEDGREIVDAVSSWWVNIHGHCHPHIIQKITEQLQSLHQIIFAGFTHKPAAELADRLLTKLPANQAKVFYSDNGSTAVEVAVKMGLQYWHNQGVRKKKIITLKDGYHGDTFGAMSVSGRGLFVEPFTDFLFETVELDLSEPDSGSIMEKVCASGEVALFLFEPLVQGAGGMKMHSPETLNNLLKISKEHSVITIADEVMTGFGRTGNWFASDTLTLNPDIMCLSKGLTGGTLPLGVTTCSAEIYRPFKTSDKTKTFFHGHSFTANPLACAAALASLDLLERESSWENIARINASHKTFAEDITKCRQVQNLRITGTIIAFEIESAEATYLSNIKEIVLKKSLADGIFLRPLGNTVYIMPPYCITDKELQKVYRCVKEILEGL